MNAITTYDASVTGVVELLAVGYCNLESVEIENPNTTVVYLQLFDSATTAAVTLGTTVPNTTRLIPAGDGVASGVRIIEFNAPLRFGSGIVYAITTTRSDNTSPASVCQINFARS
jgi:hypothetical protein